MGARDVEANHWQLEKTLWAQHEVVIGCRLLEHRDQRYEALILLACNRMAATANTLGTLRRLQEIRSELEVGLQCLKLKINFPNRVGRQIGVFSARKCHFKHPAFFHDIRSCPWNILCRSAH